MDMARSCDIGCRCEPAAGTLPTLAGSSRKPRPRRIRMKKTSADNPPRPMNCFMIWSQTRRPQLAQANPELANNQISRLLGAEWKNMSSSERKIYEDMAAAEKREHATKYPNYRFQPGLD